MADIFISYSSSDEQIANRICENFEQAGLSCWIAPRDIQAGKEYGGEIIRGIENSKVFFMCLSKTANESQHVLREVERAVNRKLPILVYQQEETKLSKSLEYFLASTQWFIPDENNGMNELVEVVGKLKGKEKNIKDNLTEKTKNKRKKWIWSFVAIAAICFISILLGIFSGRNKTEVAVGDVFSYGRLDLTGESEENLNWLVLDINEEEKTVLCIAENVVAFFPYDGAESGMRGMSGDLYYNASEEASYSDEQMVQFWGSSDWESANIRSWLNSEEAIVTYVGTKPTTDTASLYENGYETQPGFLYGFTEEEKSQLITTLVDTQTMDGQSVETEDRVFLLNLQETEKYFVEQNIVISAAPTESAVLLEGTGLYMEYYEQGQRSTYWGLRTQGEDACSILCAGTGLGETENFHSKYACTSLMGVRPAIVLPMKYVERLARVNM